MTKVKIRISRDPTPLLRSMKITFCRSHRLGVMRFNHRTIRMTDRGHRQGVSRSEGNRSLGEAARRDLVAPHLTLRLKAQRLKGQFLIILGASGLRMKGSSLCSKKLFIDLGFLSMDLKNESKKKIKAYGD